MDAPCKIQGNIHGLLCLIHKINVSRILGTYHIGRDASCGGAFCCLCNNLRLLNLRIYSIHRQVGDVLWSYSRHIIHGTCIESVIGYVDIVIALG